MWLKTLPTIAILLTMVQSFQLILHNNEFEENHTWFYLFVQGIAWVCGISFINRISICFLSASYTCDKWM